MGCPEHHLSYLGSQPVESHCIGLPSGSLNPGAWLISEAVGMEWQSDFVRRHEALGEGFGVKEEVAEVWGSLTISYKVGGRVF